METIEYKIFYDLIPFEMCVVNKNFQIVHHNKIMKALFPAQDFAKITIHDIVDFNNRENKNFLNINNRLPIQCKLSGKTRFMHISINHDSQEAYLLFLPIDTTSAGKEYNDALTGLPTRKIFIDKMLKHINNSKQNKYKTAILFMDLNKFKPVNDIYGHEAGDIVLQEVSKRIKDSLRTVDTIARFGGDEFVIALTGLQAGIHASLGAKRILKLIDKPINIGETEVSVSGSIGISIFPEDGDTIDELIKKADEAMYNAKNKKTGYSFYDFKKLFLG